MKHLFFLSKVGPLYICLLPYRVILLSLYLTSCFQLPQFKARLIQTCQQQSICVSTSCLCSAIGFTPCPTMFTPHVVQGQDAPHCTTKGTTAELRFCCHPNLDNISIQTRKIRCTSQICIVVFMGSALSTYKMLWNLRLI